MLKKESAILLMNEPLFTNSIAIVAGGKSSRFGSEKAFAPFLQALVIDYVIKACKESGANEICIIANKEQYKKLGLPVYSDIFKGLGPLAGIHSALAHSKAEQILVVACDMPLLSSLFLKWMLAQKEKLPVTIPFFNNRFQPLHAIYHQSLLPVIEKRLRKKELSLKGLLDEVPYYPIPEEQISPFCPEGLCFASANTKEELSKLEAIAPSYFEKLLSYRNR